MKLNLLKDIKRINIIIAFILIIFGQLPTFSQGNVPININVSSAISVTDISDNANPTLPVNIAVAPDVGATSAYGVARFRVRTSLENWQLTAQRTGFSSGTTNIMVEDVSLSITKTAGMAANVNACTLQNPFDTVTNLNSISDSSPTVVCGGTTTKISNVKSPSNTQNFLEFFTNYFIKQDFFYSAGTASDTITYTVSAI